MMNETSSAWATLQAGHELQPLRLTISAAANERYWRAAGVEHPLLRAGALYPPIAANLTILSFGRLCPDAMIQTRQRLVCHRRADAPATLPPPVPEPPYPHEAEPFKLYHRVWL